MIAIRAALAALATGCLSKPGFECTFAPSSSELDAPLGTNDGPDEHPVSDCGDRWVVGLGFTMTQSVDVPLQVKTAVTAVLRCATLSTHNGDHATGAINDVAVPGGTGNTEGPFFASCPDGQAVVGLAAHIADPIMNHLFNSIAISCSAVDELGAPTGGITQVPVSGTGSNPSETEALCSAGAMLYGLKAWSGAELDRVQLVCGQAVCGQAP